VRITEGLRHRAIARVVSSGEFDGQLYFVLPYLEGGTLRARMLRERQMSIADAVAITRTIADALDFAHSQGLIHRDVKPENILFGSGQAVLADFGIARALERAIDESTTSTGIVRGTPAYMSPEQASGNRNYDGRSDIYSLACVLYEMVTGMPAFLGPTPEAIIAQRFQHAPRPMRVYRATVPPAIELVLEKALALVPADRYTTAAEFSLALQSAITEVPSQADAPTSAAPARRSRALVAGGARPRFDRRRRCHAARRSRVSGLGVAGR
jgi:serine/threonine-protein kinase